VAKEASSCRYCGADFAVPLEVSPEGFRAHANIWFTICSVFWIVTNIASVAGLLVLANTAINGGVASGRYGMELGILCGLFLASVCVGISVATGMLIRAEWSYRVGYLLSLFGTFVFTLLAILQVYLVFIAGMTSQALSLVWTVAYVVMSFVTRWAITSTEDVHSLKTNGN